MFVSNASQQHQLTNIVYFHQDDAKVFKSNYIKITSEQNEIVLLRDTDPAVQLHHIGLSSTHRKYLNVPLDTQVKCENYYFDCADIIVSNMTCGVDVVGSKKNITIGLENIQREILSTISGHILKIGQIFLIRYDDTLFRLTVHEFTYVNQNVIHDEYGLITSKTECVIDKPTNTLIKITGDSSKSSNVFKVPNLDPVGLGIGGLNKEFVDIVRRTLFSRVFPKDIIDKLGIIHVKGIMLYGPPGTGKTLMARTIAKMLNCHEPKIVTGPELFNKYVGETEANIRKLFADAEKEYAEHQDDSDLHIIVIDEIDAICGKRGTGSGEGTRVGDNAVDQLLAKIDGVNGLNNVLLIGMTNRLDMIDSAILRPGRFEVRIEVGLPDEEGRTQIFKIHTNKMSSTNCLDESVKITELAKLTKNFTGAEIAGLVKNASSFALMEKFNFQNFQQMENLSDIKVKREHFDHALLDATPLFGIDSDELPMFIPKKIITYNSDYIRIQNEFEIYFKQILESNFKNTLSILLTGSPGCGKTSMVANMSLKSGFPYVKIITPSNLVKYSTEHQKYTHITSIFEDAYRSSSSIIILDDLEGLLDYVPLGPRFSNSILQLLKTLTKKYSSKNKLVVIGTCSNVDILKELGLYDQYDFKLAMTDITTQSDYQNVIDILYNDNTHKVATIEHPMTINEILLQFEYDKQRTK
jgi:vesicle-fusing ATPase